MLISVVIPAYNEEKYIKETLLSLKNQSAHGFDFEIIVVDSSSTDKTAEIATEMGAGIISVPKINPGFARQKGVEKAKGEIIACIDADSSADSKWLINIVNHFKNENIVGLTGKVLSRDKSVIFTLFYLFFTPVFYKLNFLLGKTIFQGQNFAVKKDAFLKIGGFTNGIISAEDADLGNRLSSCGRVIYAQDVLVRTSARRLGEGSKIAVRWPMAYLKLVWGIDTGNYEKVDFPSIR
ncbi:MAG: Glycosyltransferase, probably involved in cell wall biogenesis [Candidatus Gottesmanbacteria bacterium GW2011_GWA2_41_12]|uniref:Glycosyltransferase, probably involved in cell wall biogenesis n=2 Tax=Candidatus Gottesmaniibacteriota TaxID=1752720 RepID=A0A0G0UM75_9BACT|nr:MAG: Glycosyltransferase, probably involved in cell wall biogenesis [Candidatus Gottesmanbacteria bacterium GW2011_GWC2_39_8]KKR88616.1 MAG: Glycosyltransferase, probably involved in cell wall biogenesis [Candidatus Gottesmanbacteria bacterium GW2011_GWA2_41_12]